MSRNEGFKTPPREIRNGSRVCVVCSNSDLYCTCNDEQHRNGARHMLGGRHIEVDAVIEENDND